MSVKSMRVALLASAMCLPLFAVYPVIAATPALPADSMAMAHAMPNATFTLRSGIAQGKMV